MRGIVAIGPGTRHSCMRRHPGVFAPLKG